MTYLIKYCTHYTHSDSGYVETNSPVFGKSLALDAVHRVTKIPIKSISNPIFT